MTQIKINGQQREIISFNARITNKSIAVQGIGLAQGYLAIADNYRIYNTRSGEPLLRCKFDTLDLCLWFAEQLEYIYQDYFDLWLAYPKADLISWCKYSVENGAWWFEVKEILDGMEIVTTKDIDHARIEADKLVERWKIH